MKSQQGTERRETAARDQAHRHPTQGQQVRATDQGEGVQMRRGATPSLRAVLCRRRDGRRGHTRSRHHGLISWARGRAASSDQPTPFRGLRNALNFLLSQPFRLGGSAHDLDELRLEAGPADERPVNLR